MDKTTSFSNSKGFFLMIYRVLINRCLQKQKRDKKNPDELDNFISLNIKIL